MTDVPRLEVERHEGIERFDRVGIQRERALERLAGGGDVLALKVNGAGQPVQLTFFAELRKERPELKLGTLQLAFADERAHQQHAEPEIVRLCGDGLPGVVDRHRRQAAIQIELRELELRHD